MFRYTYELDARGIPYRKTMVTDLLIHDGNLKDFRLYLFSC